MQEYEKLGVFYLGRLYDPSAHRSKADYLLYDSKDLVTHAVCVGMTGSGKTGLCIDLLEEAAIDGVPAIIVDPKGDIADLLLQFPDFQTSDFLPWVNGEDARRNNLSVEDYAKQQAEAWRAGLAEWDQTGERIRKLKSSADFAIYTPGSDAGLPLSVLRSFDAPAASLVDDREACRDRVSNTATAVLSLASIEAEPNKSREHIFLSSLFDLAWRNGQSLSLESLIQQVQHPPLQKVGVMDLEAFYPAKDRFAVAMALNNLLASPGFDLWLNGEPLDIQSLLYGEGGKARMSILSIAHLSDTERMFFVTLLLNEMLSWTRAQTGTTSLRALFYMDEIFGYFPPVANPPSKRPLLTLLKQARAFGVGIVLATQNPVDLDYKGLSNTGTWFVGRLQTERDKERLLDGLEGASSESGGRFDRAAMERTISRLDKRVFLMNNVHEKAPVVFETRQALSYLPGPLTRAQIRTLMQERKSVKTPAVSAGEPKGSSTPVVASSSSRTVLPPGIPQTFLPTRSADKDFVYQPTVLGAVQIRFLDAKSGIDLLQNSVFLTPMKPDGLPVEWEEAVEASDIDPNDLEPSPQDGVGFAPLPASAANPKSYPAWQKDLVTWLYANQVLTLFCDPSGTACSQPGETEAAFRLRIQQSVREKRDSAVEQLRKKYQPKVQTLQDRLLRAQQASQREREQSQGQIVSAAVGAGTAILGALFGRKGITTAAASAIRSASRVRKDYGDVGRAEETISSVQQQLDTLKAQIESEVQSVQAEYDLSPKPLQTVAIKPKKTNIQVRLLSLAWAPYKAGTNEKMW